MFLPSFINPMALYFLTFLSPDQLPSNTLRLIPNYSPLLCIYTGSQLVTGDAKNLILPSDRNESELCYNICPGFSYHFLRFTRYRKREVWDKLLILTFLLTIQLLFLCLLVFLKCSVTDLGKLTLLEMCLLLIRNNFIIIMMLNKNCLCKWIIL